VHLCNTHGVQSTHLCIVAEIHSQLNLTKMKKLKLGAPFAIASFVLLAACAKTNSSPSTSSTSPIVIPLQTTKQNTISMGSSATTMAVLAGSGVTSTGFTIVNGDLGLSPGSSLIGFPPGIVNGTKHINDPTANQAKSDLTAAYNDAAGRTATDIVTLSGNIGGLTLTPGLYKSTSSLAISSGDLTFDAKGDTSAIFIIQIASTLTATSGRKVILAGGASASHIFWQVGSSATFGTTSVFKGTIMAMQSITFDTGATLDGKALARTGAIVMAGNTITKQ
jgi:hypothetical protein